MPAKTFSPAWVGLSHLSQVNPSHSKKHAECTNPIKGILVNLMRVSNAF